MKLICKLNPLIVIVLLASACSTAPNSVEEMSYDVSVIEDAETIDMTLMLAQQRAMDRLEAQKKEEAKKESEDEQKEIEKEHKYLLNTKTSYPKVQKWIKYYSEKDRERFQRFLNRGAPYKQVVQDLFVSNDLPPDLYYLGILESGFVKAAVSHAGAVGTWQFMGPTGRQYGLKINNYVDERVDPIRSTLAASRYLKELFRQKKSWYLALASYNAGPGRVKRAMRRARRRGRAQNYWSLTKRRLLPYDTREYIPQFLAILYIGKNLEKFGFVEESKEPLHPMELVKLPSPVKLDKIAEITGVSKEEIKKLNPNLIKDMTPPGVKEYHVWFKKEWINKAEDSYKALAEHRIKGLKVTRSIARYSNKRTFHRVRSGHNLSKIAKRYGTSVKNIKRWNRLKSNKIYVGQRLRVRSRSIGQTRYAKKKIKYHKVRKGQNLTSISKRYGISLKQMRKINRIKGNKLLVGQKLKVYGKKKTVAKSKRYKIRRGDNLTKIAKKFGLSVREIKKINRLKTSKIKRGQSLIVSL